LQTNAVFQRSCSIQLPVVGAESRLSSRGSSHDDRESIRGVGALDDSSFQKALHLLSDELVGTSCSVHLACGELDVREEAQLEVLHQASSLKVSYMHSRDIIVFVEECGKLTLAFRRKMLILLADRRRMASLV